jgi:hypothetical protein
VTVDLARTTSPRPGIGTYAGLFGVTMSTLVLEIALTRIFSVTMWYHFAFVAISVALFGLTAGALIVHMLPRRFPESGVKQQLWAFALLFAVSVVVCFAVQLAIPFTPRLTLGGVASVVATCVVVAVPFVCSGVVVCLALTRFPRRVNRLYAVDLVGGGLGCVLLVILFSWLDGPSLIVLIGALAAVAAAAFALDAGNRRGVALATTAAIALGGFAVANAYLHTRDAAPLKIVWVKETRDGDHDYERWNAFSRLTLDGDPADAAAKEVGLYIDSTAGTQMNRYGGDPAESDFLRDEIQNLPHHIRREADVFVIGVGGGTDVLSALEFDQRSVTGLEMNGDIIDIAHRRFADFTGHLDDDPRVELVNDEARSYLARTDRRYDLIQISLIDTWAATGAGAYALTENSLYTTEAWNLFLDRLQPGGFLDVTRFYQDEDAQGNRVQPVETYRTVALASEVLTQRGVERPRDHLAIYSVPTGVNVDLATVLVARDPISAADRAVLDARAEGFGFTPLLTADSAADPMLERLTAPGGPDAVVEEVSADISPPTDDRPFFFQMADLDTFREGGITRDDFVTRPVLILGGLAVVVLALAALCIAAPLLAGRRTGQSYARRRYVPFYLYFAGIGLGFLLIEVAQLQRLSIFLGHPTYGLTVVLFSVLVFSGIGSLLTERFLRADRAVTLIAPLVALLAALLVFGLATPAVIEAAESATTPARIATAVALLAPLSLLMGMPFALGMSAAAARPGTPRAFLWAINGATSVCASVFGVVIALFLGINAAFWAGALAYVLALAGMAAIVAPGERPRRVGRWRSAWAETAAHERSQHAHPVERG